MNYLRRPGEDEAPDEAERCIPVDIPEPPDGLVGVAAMRGALLCGADRIDAEPPPL
jgi:hypothetical protein